MTSSKTEVWICHDYTSPNGEPKIRSVKTIWADEERKKVSCPCDVADECTTESCKFLLSAKNQILGW